MNRYLEKKIERKTQRLCDTLVENFFSKVSEAFTRNLEVAAERFSRAVDQTVDQAEKVVREPEAPRVNPLDEARAVLGVSEGDSIELVKSVFRAKAKHFHPDSGTGSKEAFQRLEGAYNLIVKDLERQGRK